MSRKKIVLLIVEGPSDDEALSLSLLNLFEKFNQEIQVEIVFGDVTSDRDASPSNIVRKVADIIKAFLKRYHVKKTDISEVIQITDTDGAFVPEHFIFEDPKCEKTEYSLTSIKTKNKESIIERNAKKSQNLRKLRQTNKILSIPYHIVYMSCNLDHVLYNVFNSSDTDKTNNSFRFNKQYRNDLNGFWYFISKSSFSVSMDFINSWKFIEKDANSLKRYSNIHLVLPCPKQE